MNDTPIPVYTRYTAVSLIANYFFDLSKYAVWSLLILITAQQGKAQFQPVQVTTQLVPPYAVYLADYATPGNDKLRLVVLQRDLTKPSYQIRLQLSVELNGKTILRTSPVFNPPPIALDPGIPSIISGADLQPYLDSRNLDFTGYSRDEYERTKAFPEGSYQLCFTAYDYRRQNVPVSEPGCSFYWLSKNEPPLINFPACGAGVTRKDPQQIVFSWTPRNTASPNSAADTEYEFSLYEIRPDGRDPNDVVLSSEPVYRIVTGMTQLVYGPAEPFLIENLTYAWRVRAMDKSGRDQFRNNGYSEVCTFIYGAADAVQWQAISGLKAAGETETRGKVWWEAQEVDGYRINYKKAGSSYKWFTADSNKPEALLFDLEADTRYEVRIQPRVGSLYGPYSGIGEFKTQVPRTFQCGETADVVAKLENPLPAAIIGMTIDVQGIMMTIVEVSGPHGAGIYSGRGEVSIPYFGGAVFNVAFNDLYINDRRVAQQGRIDFITKGVEAMIDEQLAEQRNEEREAQQEKNREDWAGTDFHDEIFYYDDIVIDKMYTNDQGEVVIVDEHGTTYVNKDIPAIIANAPEKAIIIEDKNGDQWVVQKDGKITKVPAGGLSPTMDVVVSEEALNLVKEALHALHLEYDAEKMATIERDLTERRAAVQTYVEQYNREILKGASTTGGTGAEDTGNATGGHLFFNFVAVPSPGEETDKEFERLSAAENEKARERNRGVFLNFLGNNENLDQMSKLVAHELEVENKPVSEYIEKEKQGQNLPEDIKSKIRGEIINLIDNLLKEAAKSKSEDEL